MSRFIRKESDVALIQPDGYYLLDLEPLVQKHPEKAWRHLKVPELVLWNNGRVVVLEVKKSVPRERKEACPADLKERAAACGYDLVSQLDRRCESLREKFSTALLLMRPDVMNRFLGESTGCEPERMHDLRRGCLLEAEKVKLILLVKGVPEEQLPALQDLLRGRIESKLKSWQPNCAFCVLNERLAIEHGYAAAAE